MARMNRDQYITYLGGLGKSDKDIWRAIKKHPTLKYLPNAIIKDSIDAFRQAARAGQRVMGYEDTTRLSRSKYAGYDEGWGSICVEFTFKYQNPDDPVWEKQLKGGQPFMFELPTTATKGDLMEQVKDIIGQWIDEHYEGKNKRGVMRTVNITQIRGC